MASSSSAATVSPALAVTHSAVALFGWLPPPRAHPRRYAAASGRHTPRGGGASRTAAARTASNKGAPAAAAEVGRRRRGGTMTKRGHTHLELAKPRMRGSGGGAEGRCFAVTGTGGGVTGNAEVCWQGRGMRDEPPGGSPLFTSLFLRRSWRRCALPGRPVPRDSPPPPEGYSGLLRGAPAPLPPPSLPPRPNPTATASVGLSSAAAGRRPPAAHRWPWFNRRAATAAAAHHHPPRQRAAVAARAICWAPGC